MANYSILDKIKILFKTIISNPFFSLSALFGLILAILMIIDIIKQKKIRKRYYIAAWFFVFFFITTKYMKVIPKLFDNLINQIFMTLYFPSLDLLFVIIINIIVENNIDITSEITLYTNSNLLVLLEISTALFVSWILLIIFISAYLKLKVLDNNLLFEKDLTYPEMDVYVNDSNSTYKRKVIPAFHSTYHN